MICVLKVFQAVGKEETDGVILVSRRIIVVSHLYPKSVWLYENHGLIGKTHRIFIIFLFSQIFKHKGFLWNLLYVLQHKRHKKYEKYQLFCT